MLSQEFIDKVKQTIDIVELASEYTELKKVSPNVFQGICPNPNHEDKTASFTIFVDSQSWCCYGCHYGDKDINGNVGSDCFALISWLEGCNFRQAVLKLAKRQGITVPTEKHTRVLKENQRLANFYKECLTPDTLKYLYGRGLDDKDIEEWQLGYDYEFEFPEEVTGRITFPLMDRYKTILGFTKRSLILAKGKKKKYKNSPNSETFNKSFYLYGIHNIDTRFNEIRITEGPMDVILGTKYKVKNLVAPLGTAFTENHAQVIKKLGLVPVFCMDGDESGMKSIKKSVDMLSKLGIYSKIYRVNENMDIADMALEYKESLEDMINLSSITYGNFISQEFILLYNSKLNELKQQFLPTARTLCDKIPNEEKTIIKSSIENLMQIKL